MTTTVQAGAAAAPAAGPLSARPRSRRALVEARYAHLGDGELSRFWCWYNAALSDCYAADHPRASAEDRQAAEDAWLELLSLQADAVVLAGYLEGLAAYRACRGRRAP